MEPSVLSGRDSGVVPAQHIPHDETVAKVKTARYRHPLNVPGEPRQLYLTATITFTTLAVFAALGVASYATSGTVPVVVAVCCALFAVLASCLRGLSVRQMHQTQTGAKDGSRALPVIIGALAHLVVAVVLVLCTQLVISEGDRAGVVMGLYLGLGAFFVMRGLWAVLVRRIWPVVLLIAIDTVACAAMALLIRMSQYQRSSAEHALPVLGAALMAWTLWQVVKLIDRRMRRADD